MRTLAVLVVGAAICGCQSMPQEPATLLHCDNGDVVEVGYSGEVAMVTYKNQLHRMHLEMSQLSARYVGDGLEWQTHGFGQGVMTPLPQAGAPAPISTTCKAGAPAK